MTYIECPQCRRKALSVATRCPHCGLAFPSQTLRRSPPRPQLERLGPVLAVVGVLLLGVAMVAVVIPKLRSRPAAVAPGAASQNTVQVPSAAPSTPATADTSAALARPPLPGREEPVPGAQGVRRYARTWANVRGARGRFAPALSVLNPGDAVLVDSLSRGWYRVLVNGRTAGYVHRSTLGTAPPPETP